jgi:DNA-binding protein H-NS
MPIIGQTREQQMSIDLNSMSRKDLMKLRGDVDRALASVADRERKAALDAVAKVAAEHGFTVAELTGSAMMRGAGRKSKGPAKYRNPADPSQTWSGKGRRPDWFKAAEASGRNMDDFLA